MTYAVNANTAYTANASGTGEYIKRTQIDDMEQRFKNLGLEPHEYSGLIRQLEMKMHPSEQPGDRGYWRTSIDVEIPVDLSQDDDFWETEDGAEALTKATQEHYRRNMPDGWMEFVFQYDGKVYPIKTRLDVDDMEELEL